MRYIALAMIYFPDSGTSGSTVGFELGIMFSRFLRFNPVSAYCCIWHRICLKTLELILHVTLFLHPQTPLTMAPNDPDDLPPSYMSQNSQTSTLTDRPNPALLKPGHSTRASGLSNAASQGTLSILEYHELTFAAMFSHHGTKKLMVIAVDEQLDAVIKDVQRIYGPSYFASISQLRVELAWGSAIAKSVGNGERLSEENVVAYLRFVKSRNGVDVISAK